MKHLKLIGLALAALATTAGAPDHSWKTYANVRFAYQVCYPADMLTPQPEAPNGDGRAFTAKDGGELRVWGSNNAMEDTVASAANSEATYFAQRGGAVTYKVIKPQWYVLSGHEGDKLVYHRSRLVKDVFKDWQLKYPTKDAKLWEPLVAKVSACFRSLDGPTAG